MSSLDDKRLAVAGMIKQLRDFADTLDAGDDDVVEVPKAVLVSHFRDMADFAETFFAEQ